MLEFPKNVIDKGRHKCMYYDHDFIIFGLMEIGCVFSCRATTMYMDDLVYNVIFNDDFGRRLRVRHINIMIRFKVYQSLSIILALNVS